MMIWTARCLCYVLVLGQTFGWGPLTSNSFVQKSWTPARQHYDLQTQCYTPRHFSNTQLKAFSAYDDDAYYDEEGEEGYDDEEELTDEQLATTMGEWDDRIARFNTVHLTGRIGSDPEPKYFDDGKVVVNLNLATKRKYHGLERKALDIKAGEEGTDWYNLEIWGQKAEFVSKYVDKGARIGVLGQLQIDTWNDKVTNLPRKRARVIVRELDLLETKAEAELRRSRSEAQSESEEQSENTSSDGGFFADT